MSPFDPRHNSDRSLWKGGGAPPIIPPNPPATKRSVEVKQAERDQRKQAVRRKGRTQTLLGGIGPGGGAGDREYSTLLGG